VLPKVADDILDDPFPLLDVGISVGPIGLPAPLKDLLLLVLRQEWYLLDDLTCVWVVQLDPLQVAWAGRCIESPERGSEKLPSVDGRG
jgi:hypothetical protein